MRKFLVLVSMLMMTTGAQAQIPTTDIAALIQRVLGLVSEYSQEAEMIEQVEQTYNVVKETANTAKSLQDQLGSALNIDQAQSIDAVLNKIRQANALNNDASGMQKQFDDDFSNDATFEKSHVVVTASTRQAAISNAATLDSLPNDAERLNKLVDQSNASTGALQAQQAGNQINAELAGQMMALRQQLALQAQAQNAEAGMRAKSDMAQAEITREFFGGKMK